MPLERNGSGHRYRSPLPGFKALPTTSCWLALGMSLNFPCASVSLSVKRAILVPTSQGCGRTECVDRGKCLEHGPRGLDGPRGQAWPLLGPWGLPLPTSLAAEPGAPGHQGGGFQGPSCPSLSRQARPRSSNRRVLQLSPGVFLPPWPVSSEGRLSSTRLRSGATEWQQTGPHGRRERSP